MVLLTPEFSSGSCFSTTGGSIAIAVRQEEDVPYCFRVWLPDKIPRLYVEATGTFRAARAREFHSDDDSRHRNLALQEFHQGGGVQYAWHVTSCSLCNVPAWPQIEGSPHALSVKTLVLLIVAVVVVSANFLKDPLHERAGGQVSLGARRKF